MKNVVFYGGGSISQAIIEGLIASGFNKENIFYVDRNSTNNKKLKKLKIRSFKKNNNAKVNLFILAVKPKDAIDAYKEILDQHKNPKVISLVAGIRSKKYRIANPKL